MNPDNKMEFSQNLNSLISQREKDWGRKISTNEIAIAIKVSPDYVRKIRKGKRVGSPPVLSLLAVYLQCHVNDFFAPLNKTSLNGEDL